MKAGFFTKCTPAESDIIFHAFTGNPPTAMRAGLPEGEETPCGL
jgi:hypothetical protein